MGIGYNPLPDEKGTESYHPNRIDFCDRVTILYPMKRGLKAVSDWTGR